MAGSVDLARAAFVRRHWNDACALFESCDVLVAEDTEQLAIAAHLAGRIDQSDAAWERAHLAYERRGDHGSAARCACWLAMGLLLRGDAARANGWFARVRRIVDGAPDCPARALALVPVFLAEVAAGDAATAASIAAEILDLADRFDDPVLLSFGLLCRGEALLALGECDHGLTLLDEAMVVVTAEEMTPIAAGIVYCAVVDACMRAHDIGRAAQWTAALDRWCAGQPDLVPFRGQCLVHRSQILQARGEWVEALHAASGGYEHLSALGHPALGQALYQLGEVQRLRGDAAGAERSYRAAGAAGREPLPGLALLRLAQGKHAAAVATVRRVIDERREDLDRPAVLAAAVDILIATHDVAGARIASEELVKIADSTRSALLRATAQLAAGSVLLADGDPASALTMLRPARDGWIALEMPHPAARTSARIGLACRDLGDEDSADLELEAARQTFQRLGAKFDLEALGTEPPGGQDQLTAREREVLRLVAAGRTNREIATTLVISKHTVNRHVQNIFAKLGLSSRTAAAAYAYEHHLV